MAPTTEKTKHLITYENRLRWQISFLVWLVCSLVASVLYTYYSPPEEFADEQNVNGDANAPDAAVAPDAPPEDPEYRQSLLNSYAATDAQIAAILKPGTQTLTQKDFIDQVSGQSKSLRGRMGTVMGTTWETDKVYPPAGTTMKDWNIFVGFRNFGMEEKDYEQDNALIRARCFAEEESDHWKVRCRYKYRKKESDGVWYENGVANWLLARKRLV